MNLREAAQQALDELIAADGMPICNETDSLDLSKTIEILRAALANTQDWDEVEALRESLREHMAEIHRLRAAGRQAINTLFLIRDSATGLWGEDLDRCNNALDHLIADFAEQPVTDCHDLEQARAVAISNLLTHFGITSANSDVNAVYLHKQLDDFLMAVIGCSKEGDKLSPPFDHIPDATKMMASVREDRTVEPVAYVTGYSKGYATVKPVDPCLLMPVGMALYRAPPKRKPLTEEEISAIDWKSGETLHDFARAIEQAHGIGGEE